MNPQQPPSEPSETNPEEQSFYHDDTVAAATPLEAPASEQNAAADDAQAQSNSGDIVTWTAAEFIAHDKTQTWFIQLGGVTVVVAAIVYFITRDLFSTVVVIIAGILFGVVAGRQPRELPYEVGSHGLVIGQKHYLYSSFRSFSVFQEGEYRGINFMPLKRFAPPLSIYFDPADEQRIVNVLASHLPLENHKNDAVDKLMRWIRF